MKDSYDVIVVGAGNGGLVAGTKCAKAGLSTAIFEKHNLPGGCATSFVRGRFEFEASLHELAGITTDGSDDLSRLFSDLGINIDWRFDDYAYRVICKGENGFDVKLPTGEENFIQAIAEEVPDSKESVEKLFKIIHNIFDALKYMNEGGKINPLTLFTKYPDFLRASSTSAEAIMNELGIPEKAKAILCTYWGYLGVPTDELCATHFLCLLGSYVASPVAMPRNKSHALSVALDKAFRGFGGEIFYNTPVTKFVYGKKGECIGIEACGRTIYAKKVIANIMPDLVYELSEGKVPEYNRKVANAKEFGASFLTIYLGLDASREQLGIDDYSLFVINDGNPRHQYENRLDFGVYVVNCLEKVVDNASPEGTCTLFFTIPIFGEDVPLNLSQNMYKKYKNDIAEKYIRDYERVTGVDVLSHIEEISVATPVTFARYLNTPMGEVYGYKTSDWDNIINRTICSQSEQKIKNLYFCGGHQDMGDGFSCAYSSGESVAERIVQELKEGK